METRIDDSIFFLHGLLVVSGQNITIVALYQLSGTYRREFACP